MKHKNPHSSINNSMTFTTLPLSGPLLFRTKRTSAFLQLIIRDKLASKLPQEAVLWGILVILSACHSHPSGLHLFAVTDLYTACDLKRCADTPFISLTL